MKFEQVTMFKAPDGSMYATMAEAQSYATGRAAEFITSLDAIALKAALTDPQANPAIVDALDLLSKTANDAKAAAELLGTTTPAGIPAQQEPLPNVEGAKPLEGQASGT